jgi:preprotein translocase subunit SecA
MFNAMMDGIKEESVGNLFNRQFEIQENPIVEEVGAGAQLGFGGALPGVTAGQAAAAQAAAPAAAAPAAAPATPAAARRRQPPPAPPSVPEPVAPPAAFGKRSAGSQPRTAQPAQSAQPAQPQGDQQPGGRARGRHAANDGRGHATAAGRGQAATRSGGTPAPSSAAPEDFGPGVTDSPETAAAAAAGPHVVAPAGLEPRRPRQLQYSAPSDSGGVETHGDASLDPYASVGRNDMCPCGSGRKFKRCHGGAGRS